MVGKGKEGRFTVRYETFPASYDTQLVVLDTDYDSYAVMWSCSDLGGIGHTQSAWVMTRERIPPGPVLQSAYGVLDKFKLSRSYFVTTDQIDCITLAPPLEAIDPTERSISKNLDDILYTGEKIAEEKEPEVLVENIPEKIKV